MASTRELAINIVGDSKGAVRAFDDVGDAADRNSGKFTAAKGAITVASAAVVAGVVAFATDSVKAFDDGGRYIGGAGKRGRPPVGKMRSVSGKITAEFDSTTFRDALRDNTAVALVATFQGATDITAGNKPTVQVVIPDVRFRGGLPQPNKGDVIKQDMEFTAFDGLVAAHALYIVTRTGDTAL